MRRKAITLLVILGTAAPWCTASTPEYVDSYRINYRFNAAGGPDGQPDFLNPFRYPAVIQPGPLVLSLPTGRYRVTVMGYGPQGGVSGVAYAGDGVSGVATRVVAPVTELTLDHGQIRLFAHDWAPGDNSPDIWTDVAVYRLGALPIGSALPASADLFVGTAFGTGDTLLHVSSATGWAMEDFVKPGSPLFLPMNITFGPDGDLYLVSRGSQVDETPYGVLRYDGRTGAYKGLFIPKAPDLWQVSGAAFGPDGDYYAALHVSSGVLRFDGRTGARKGYLVLPGSGGIVNANGMIFGPDGNLYVANGDASNILRFNGRTGDPLPSPGNNGAVFAPAGHLIYPYDLTFGPNGDLYVTGYNSSNVVRFDGQTGAFVSELVTRGRGGLSHPLGLAFGPDLRLYVVQEATPKVLSFDGSTGAFLGAALTFPASGPSMTSCLRFRTAGISALRVETLSQTSVRVRWSTTAASDSRVDYGTTASLGSSTYSPVLTLDHAMVLTGLISGTAYRYRVRSAGTDGVAAGSGSFSTPGPSSPTVVVRHLATRRTATGAYEVDIEITNGGSTALPVVDVTGARLGAALVPASALESGWPIRFPFLLGTVGATIIFPSSAGQPGSSVALGVGASVLDLSGHVQSYGTYLFRNVLLP
ncbi:MAG TPA: hypothetical protein VGN26_16405 [Armatimonadota bacterium]|jgi:WD40 repeat protein